LLTGVPKDELDTETWLPYVVDEDREPGNERWMQGIASGQMIEFEQRVRRSDGGLRNYLVRAVPVRETDGRVREWIGVDIDVTEQRRAEAALRRSEIDSRATAERLSLALEAGQLNTWDWDVRHDRIVWSEASELILGPTPDRIEGFIETVHPDDRARVREAIRRSLEDREPYEVEYRTTALDGVQRWLYVRGEAYFDEQGQPTRMLGVDVDVTERKNREVFEQDFVANVAHDIKNPLAAVKAQTQLLRRRIKNGKFDPATIDGVLAVLDAGLTRMNRRIEELADVARLRAGRQLELRKDSVNLVAMVRGLIDAYQQATDRHTIALRTDEPELFGLFDPGRIERVIDNLISNAVKYSPDGGEIAIDLARDANDPNVAVLSITDRGIGIPASDLPHIFDRYRRAGNTAVITGTGIGLAGSRQIVEQHGGTIDVVSNEGAGSTFTVRIPLSVTAPAGRAVPTAGTVTNA
jgi:PAS domain S-box-containing protein